MSEHDSSGRELLLGLLAVQQGFLSHDNLFFAVNRWVSNKSVGLHERLINDGFLKNDEAQLLDGLVKVHLGRNAGNVQHSIAALSGMEGVRDSLLELNDPDLYETLAGDCRSGNVQPKRGTRSRSTERFRVIRPHARGGLGEVFVAQDEELNREVALKEIRPQYADRIDSRDRFVLEAEVTGGLEHPGIVPVYGLGQYGDGRPYYAMRFIKGNSLHDEIESFHLERGHESRLLQLRKLLGRFVDVCQAVSYAHSRGVLHRDLKPGNIMLGKYGETLVVDWGLAKVSGRRDTTHGVEEATLQPRSGRSAAPTAMGSAIGTPAYMPPEQANGSLEELGPVSDVYSLGATLYQLLTGRAPYAGDDAIGIVERVKKGEFDAPRRVSSWIPRPLEAVCLKAMAFDPSDRYSSPTQLADEIEAWLADEPVVAYREPALPRLRRWIRKHPTMSATASVFTLSVIIGLSVLTSVIADKNQSLTALNQTLEAKNEELSIANAKELAARSLSIKNEKAANRQADLAWAMFNGTLNDVRLWLKSTSASGEVRRRLLQLFLERVDQLADGRLDQSAINEGTVNALLEMADVVSTNGGSELENGSKTELARGYLIRAEALARRSASLSNASDRSRSAHIDALIKLADNDLQIGETETAQKRLETALDLGRKLAMGKTGFNGNSLALALCALGDVERDSNRLDQALDHYEEAIDLVNQIAIPAQSQDSSDADLHNLRIKFQNLAGISQRIGDVKFQKKDLDGALAAYQSYLAATQGEAKQYPGDIRLRRGESIAHEKLGNVRLAMGEEQAAFNSYELGLEISRGLVREDPSNANARLDLTVSLQKFGDVQLALGGHVRAFELYEERHQILEELVAEDPSSLKFKRSLALSHSRLGDVARTRKEFTVAAERYSNSVQIGEELVASDPKRIDFQLDLEYFYITRGIIQSEGANQAGMVGSFRSALKVSLRLLEHDPANARFARKLVMQHERLGMAYSRLRQYSEAAEQYRAGVAILESETRWRQDIPEWQMLLNRIKNRLATLDLALGDWDQLLQQPDGKLASLLLIRAFEFDSRNEHQEVVLAAAEVCDVESVTAEGLYNASCLIFRSASALRPEPGESELTGQNQILREQWLNLGMKALRQAVDQGYRNASLMTSDSDLDIARRHPGFSDLLERVNDAVDSEQTGASGGQ